MNALFKITIVTLSFIFSLSLNAAYLTYVPIKVNQPDGTVLNIFATGDEFYNWLHDENDFTIVQDKITGVYCYAILENEQLVPTNILPGVDDPTANGLEPNINLPLEVLNETIDFFTEDTPASISKEDFLNAEGQVKINNIVVYVRFADQDEYRKEQSVYTDIFNKTGDGVNSVANYIKEVSYDKLDIHSTFYPANDGTIVLSYQDAKNRSYYLPYHPETNTNGYDVKNEEERRKREHDLVTKAVNFVKNEIPTDLDLDFNNDDKVDNISFVLRGNPSGYNQIMWPHRWALYNSFEYINGKQVYDYIFLIEKYNDIGVVCHEIIHIFGTPDLYHRYPAFSKPVGEWDIMANNTNPPQHTSAYIKHRYCGWIDNITEITTSGIYTVNTLTNANNNCYKIPLKNTDEYLVVEARLNIGTFEGNLPDSGLLIYRINEKYWGNNYTKPETAGGTYDEVYAFRPGGSIYRKGEPLKANFSANHSRKKFSNSTDPYCFTVDGSSCSVAIKNITAATAPTISFTVDFCNIGDVVYTNTSIIPPFTDAVNITTFGAIKLSNTTNITFEAKQEIELNNDFEVEKGGNFTARIVECNK